MNGRKCKINIIKLANTSYEIEAIIYNWLRFQTVPYSPVKTSLRPQKEFSFPI